MPKPTAIKIPNQIKPLIKKKAKLPNNKYLPYLFLSFSNLSFSNLILSIPKISQLNYLSR